MRPLFPLKWAPALPAVLLATGCATTSGSFQDMDADANGRIDFTEASKDPAVAEYFRSADDDKSGDLDPDEYGSIVELLKREHHDIPRRSSGSGDVHVGR